MQTQTINTKAPAKAAVAAALDTGSEAKAAAAARKLGMAAPKQTRNRQPPARLVTGAQLKTLRTSLGLTQKQAAERCGMSLTGYQKIEAGASPMRCMHCYQTLNQNPFNRDDIL